MGITYLMSVLTYKSGSWHQNSVFQVIGHLYVCTKHLYVIFIVVEVYVGHNIII